MAEDINQDVQPGEEEGGKPKKSNKGLFIVIGIIVIALAGGLGGYMLLFGGKETAETAKKKEPVKTALVGLDSFVLNLAEQGRFLKITMQLEIIDAENGALVEDRIPQLRDAIITLLSSKSAESVSSPEGKLQLKDELLLRTNQAIGKNIVKNLYFTEFVMQ